VNILKNLYRQATSRILSERIFDEPDKYHNIRQTRMSS
jgi:hypothetical protein